MIVHAIQAAWISSKKINHRSQPVPKFLGQKAKSNHLGDSNDNG